GARQNVKAGENLPKCPAFEMQRTFALRVGRHATLSVMHNTRASRGSPGCIVEPLDRRTLLASPLISVADVAVRERDANQVSYARVTVTLSRKTASEVRVGFTTKPATATAGHDFQAASGTLVIPAGTGSGSIRIKILGDNEIESSEKFYVRL